MISAMIFALPTLVLFALSYAGSRIRLHPPNLIVFQETSPTVNESKSNRIVKPERGRPVFYPPVQSRIIKCGFSWATEYNKVNELRIVREGVSNASIPLLHAKTWDIPNAVAFSHL